MKIGKKELFKGVLSGTATLDSKSGAFISYGFTIKLNEEFEGLPKEFIVSFHSRQSLFNYPKSPFFVRKGDIVTIGGTLLKYLEPRERLERIRMKANYVYNTTLKHGKGLKIKRKEVFKGKLSGTATSDVKLYISAQPPLVFSIKLDQEIEGIPNEFLVCSQIHTNIFIRNGDKLLIEGKLFQGIMGKNEFSITEMHVDHIYNTNLKYGF